MADKTLEIYKAFVSAILPHGVLDYFDLVEFTIDEETNGIYLCKETVHLYLDEKDNRTEEQKQCSISNGFSRERQIVNFPLCDKRAVLHIRRHRWLNDDGTSFTVDIKEHDEIEYPGTRYSKEFAIFLKVADGERAGDGPFNWADIYD